MQIRQLILLAGVASLLGCSDASGPGDIAIALVPTAQTFKAGEKIGISVTVTNIGSRPRVLTATGCPRAFQVFGTEGLVDLGSELCAAIARSTPLAPGDSYTFQHEWTGEKVTFSNGAVVRAPLATGFYTLRGHVAVGELGVISAGMAEVYIIQ